MPNLYAAVKHELMSAHHPVAKPSEIMALAYVFTMNNPWMCNCSAADRQEIKNLPFKGRIDHQSFTARFRVQVGVNKGKIPRFRYLPEFCEVFSKANCFDSLNHVELVGLSCSWGLFLKPGHLIVMGESGPAIIQELAHYLASPAAQIEMCIKDIDRMLPACEGDFIFMVRKMALLAGISDPGAAAERVQKIASQFAERGCV